MMTVGMLAQNNFDKHSNTQVAIVSECHLALYGLRNILESSFDISVIAEAETLTRLADECRDTSPDVIVLDAGRGQLPALRHVIRICQGSRPPVLVVSSDDNHSSVRAVLAAGAAGYLLKCSPKDEFCEAVRRLHQGYRYIDPRLSKAIPETICRVETRERKKTPNLSKRETQLLHNIVRGFTNTEIAAQLQLGLRTVETYRARLYKKLGLRTRSDLVAYANAAGLLTDWLNSTICLASHDSEPANLSVGEG